MKQRNTYLLTWNPRKFHWNDFQEDQNAVNSLGFRPLFVWSCGNTSKIAIGDRVFMMRLGWREKVTGIFASGKVTQEPWEDEHWSEPGSTTLYVEFEPDVLLDPEVDTLLNPVELGVHYNWHPQRSGVTIPPDIAERLEQAWKQHLQQPCQGEAASLRQPHTEGGKRPYSAYRYERDPQAREDCIKYYGARCVVCGFDFGEFYGPIGDGFIHVHHLRPLSEREEEYEVNAVEDLRPVCPNCHAMLHRESPSLDISDLKAMLDQTRANRRQDTTG